MERLSTKRSTRYLAKKYFDCYLNTKPDLSPSKLTLVLISCIQTAVKVNILLYTSSMNLKNFQINIPLIFVVNSAKINFFRQILWSVG